MRSFDEEIYAPLSSVIVNVFMYAQYSVAVPSQEPILNSTLVSAHAHFISFDFKPPPADSWNGILGGYVLSYTNHESHSTKKRTIGDPKEEVCFHVCLFFYLLIAAILQVSIFWLY